MIVLHYNYNYILNYIIITGHAYYLINYLNKSKYKIYYIKYQSG